MNGINVFFAFAFFGRVLGETEFGICLNKSTPVPTDEQRLHMTLMAGYHKHTRPVFNQSDTVNVTIGFSLMRIDDVHETNQVLKITVHLNQNWMDQKLKWNPEEHSGIKHIRLPSEEIWKPDITLYNSARTSIVFGGDSLAVVSFEGHVYWGPFVQLSSTCTMDLTYFPFDDQNCTLKMGSWVYNGHMVDVLASDMPVDFSTYVRNSEWYLMNANLTRNIMTYSCCPEPYPDVKFTIHIRRRTLYYTYNIFIPCILLSILSLLVFWMSPESGEKVTLGVIVLLAFAFFTWHIAVSSSHVHLLGIYLTWMMSLTSLSVIMAVTVSNVSNYGRRDTPVPAWLRKAVILLSRIVCRRLYVIKASSDMVSVFPWERNETQTGAETSGCGLKEFDNEEPNQPGGHDASQTRKQRHECEEILTGLQKLIILNGEKNTEHRGYDEWKEVAEVIDRFLFWILLTISGVMTLTLLVILPSSRST